MSLDEYSDAGNTSNISEFKRQRGFIKGRLTLFEKYIAKFDNVLLTDRQQAEIQLRMESASALLTSFNHIQQNIDKMSDDTELTRNLEYREAFEDQYFNIMSIAKCLLNPSKNDSSMSSPCTNKINVESIPIKLPDIKLPCFDGSYDHWLEYKNSYISIIHKRTDLDAIQKFHYLKSSLSGSALQVISALEFTSGNYIHAWELLESRFQNNRLLTHNHVKALFTAQSMNKESSVQIRKLIDIILRNLRALKSLNEPTDSWDTLVIYIMVSKLDSSTEREWENFKGSVKEKIKLGDLLHFLRNRADMLDMIQCSHNKPTKSFKRASIENTQPHQSYSYASTSTPSHNIGNKLEKPSRLCPMCNGSHALFSCINFLNLSVQDRINFVKIKEQLCKNCLRPGHIVSECKYGPCKQCQKKHNSLIHLNNFKSHTPQSVLSDTNSCLSQSVESKPVSIVSCAFNPQMGMDKNNKHFIQLPQVLLSTAIVEVMDSNNQYHTARALLDNGSQNSFISEKLCNRLNIPIIQSTMRILGVGQSVSHTNKLCNINMRSKYNQFNMRLQCFVLSNITSNLPSNYYDYKLFDIPENHPLADPTFYIPSEIDLLIGADVFWDLLDNNRIPLPNGPYLQGSRLGWLISGPINNKNIRYNNSHCHFIQSLSIDTQLRRFWELEEIGCTDSILTSEERKCEEHFVNTTTRDESGRFLVQVPLKEPADVLGDSYESARLRFLALERKLDRSPSYKNMYVQFMREYISLGHMSPIHKYDTPFYFLPHHGVVREHSSTTKLRVVFDASAITTTNKSFNDIQYIGPPLQNDIFLILLRFRHYKYVACADVEKMYRQILVHPSQRKLQLILWRENSSDELGIYQLNTVTYGTASAPYLSMRCLRQLAEETNDEIIAKVIKEDFFVDDLITGENNSRLLADICEKTSRVLKAGCFPLRKWTFNCDANITSSKELAIGEHSQNKTLGLGWQVNTDELHFTTRLDPKAAVTKRNIISVISQIYDPLGLLSPTIIIAKVLLQKLWLSKVDWDDMVPTEIECAWNHFITTMSCLDQIRIPRYIMSECSYEHELHIFTDASQDAYGACAYVRSYSNDLMNVTSHLLCAKSKVAPIKTVCTVPRLELCGAVLGARLYKKIIKSLRMTFTRIYFWTDSTIVMGWIRMSPHSLKTFVQNRVSQINEITGDAPWLHIKSEDNPADIVSRGMNLGELKHNKMWWHGPAFLQNSKITYKTNFALEINQLPELKPQASVSLLCNKSNSTISILDVNRFSSFNRMRRSAAYVLRFIDNVRTCKENRKFGPLSVDELAVSTDMLARQSQLESFPDEYKSLVKGLAIKSKRLIGLNIFLDKNNLIRVGGRLHNSSHFEYNKKHPILLCSKHRFTKLLFLYEHKQLMHGGAQLLLATVRESWWPIGGRNLAKKIPRECVTCMRMIGKTSSPIMGNLPAKRLEPGFPFMRCGADYAGPVMILNRQGRGASLIKGYICLFVCFTTRAVHLELVTSLSSASYLLALKRFISRRGKPIEIISDNGKNFVGAERELASFLKNHSHDIFNYTSDNHIKFSFIPPYSPHFGGLWEAGIKSCKHHLRRVVGGANLTYEEFATVLIQIEAILNSRPLSTLSTDPNDLLPLTPAHFLIGRPLTAPAAADLTKLPNHRLPRYEIIEKMRQDFWKRWAKEYVSELQTRTKWKINKDDVKLHQLVLIKDDNLPPLKWKLGRIIRIFPGLDGVSRVADLYTSSGVTRRAFSKICPLPIPSMDPKDGVTTMESKCGVMTLDCKGVVMSADPVGTCCFQGRPHVTTLYKVCERNVKCQKRHVM
ncbi:hypothetical protein K1T71_011006 [Dendrolimus kikuchii]|uniref:Uncharacterized protein n=1 Tax=Dendrolimus kikuchii TaxID=765133 RepID=A0ACC1CRG7_9NEOP|nr:hypothetical protein K1T71_011006 [Dendrolimus kikuchii]